MRAARPTLAFAIVLALLAALLSGPAGASPGRARKAAGKTKVASKSKLTFEKPVTLTSFAPIRTAVGSAYTAERGGQSSGHEWSGEPSIQIDSKGTIYIAGVCCLAAASPVWFSEDNGKTFTEMETPGHMREWGIGAEGDLAVDDEGRTYFIDTYIPGLMMSRWSENGTRWDFTAPAAGPIPGFDDRPWLAWSKKALYLYVNHVSNTAVYASTDGGMSWGSGRILEWRGDPLGQPFFPAHIGANREDGTLWVSGIVQEDGKAVLGSAVAKSIDGDFTESVVSKPQRRGGFSPIFTGATTVDEGGTGYVSWSTFDNEGCDVYYAASTNDGKSWNKPVKVNTGKGCATFPWITSGADGRIGLAWYETPKVNKPAGGEQFISALTAGTTLYGGIEVPDVAPQDELPKDAPWFLNAAVITDAAGNKPKISETRVDTGTPVLTGPLGRELWDFLQIATGPDGRIHISFVKKFKDGAPQTWYVTSRGGPRLR